ncbi:TonB family protein [Hypericibacter sp.]|uniref:TonB family protein n=1 Tax=Hypericibacter sp. TaxID=2705401 RepID=UPI003D6D1324
MTDHLAIMDSAAPSLSLERAARSYHEERIPLSPPLPDRDMRWRWAVAILAAILLHIGVVTTIDDGFQREKTRDEAPVPVEIVTEQPKPTPPPPEPKPVEKPPEPKAPPAPPEQRPLASSGGDQPDKPLGGAPAHATEAAPPPPEIAPTPPLPEAPAATAAPTLPDEPSPQAVPVPPPSAPRDTQQAMIPAPVPPRKPPVPDVRKTVITPPTQSQAATSTNSLDLQLDEGSGDKYFNAILEKIVTHSYYPPTAEMFGFKGTAVFRVTIDRLGRLVDMQLMISTQYGILDEALANAIQASAPFSPPPLSLLAGRDNVVLRVTISMPLQVR